MLVLAGGYVAYYGWYELRVLRGEVSNDPVIEAAERVQLVLQDALDWLGPVWLAVIVALLLAVPVGRGPLPAPSSRVRAGDTALRRGRVWPNLRQGTGDALACWVTT